ncbi:MAG: hypothetical protein PUF98_03285 [Oscillibacter sp.]|nr:hypothetical protein [Oscillibacter sp.]
MRTVYVQELMRLPLGKQGENGAARIVWQGLAARYQALYGSGAFTLTAKRCGDAAAYPVAVSTEGGDVVWLVRAADVANPGSGSCELTYTVDGAVAKSQTWSTYVAASISGDAPGEPPEEPAKAWFAAIQAQIGNLDDLTTKARASLVAAVNEAARTGSGGAGSISMRTADGYIQYSTDDGANWANLIALAELKGAPGQDGAPGKDGEPGKDGHTPKIAATKTGKTTSITADGVEIAQIKDGEDAAADPSLGITGAQVGQIAKITAVDASGVPTAWSPVDMPSGGGETWETINVITLSDAVNTVAINQDSGGNAIALKKVRILVVGSATANQDLFLNNSRYIRAAVVGMAASVGALSAEPFCGKMYCFTVPNIVANYGANSQLANIFSEEITITEIKLIVNNSGTFSAGTKFTIQGVRA